nr:restriction endonuclease subunit S [Porphyromonas levii]
MSRSVKETDEIITCFRDGQVTLRKLRRKDGFTESFKEIGYQGIRKGDLVIHQMDAFAGAIGISDSDGKGTPVYICLQPINHLYYNTYYAYLLREMASSQFIFSLRKGIRERSCDFRYDTFATLYLPVPPLEEQQEIVAYLDRETVRIDRIVELLTKQRERYAQLKRSLISEVVTHGLPHHNPANYRTLRLKDIVDIYKGRDGAGEFEYQEGFYPVLSLAYLRGQIENPSFSPISPNSIICNGGELIIIWDGAGIGEILIAKKGLLSSTTSVIKERKGIVLRDYVYALRYYIEDAIKNNPTGMGIPHVNPHTLTTLPISLPPLEEQQEIVAYLDERCKRLDRLVEAIDRKIDLLGSLKKSLIEEVVTGQRRITN